jgi:BirA family biotin operon repressor/biotin-[acetyl-CoA-carboxylase] ligase
VIGRPLIRLDSVTSTQDVAFRLAALGAPEGTTVVARHQQAGRGRAGRQWQTAPGDALMFSLLLRPTITGDRLTPLSILIADAIASSLESLYGLSPRVKWPNDVLLGGRKVSGVLIQVRGAVTVVGVGINFRSIPPALEGVATSILTETGQQPDPDELRDALLLRIQRNYRSLLGRDISSILDAVNNRLWLRGDRVVLHDGDRELEGVVMAIRDDAALLLDTADGIQPVISGELTRGPRSLTS